ncbi:MAG: hypothetical protein FJ253_01325 [Phycisphaerae bacterium]|nr:hypothetical protein [Phycisphaerae bacterium]
MNRRGAMLLELLVALAVLVLAASILLSAFGDVDASIDRDRLVSRAADLARTRMSELEAGLVAAEDLRAGSAGGSSGATARGGRDGGGGGARAAASAGSNGAAPRDGQEFEVDAVLSRSAFEGLTIVELRVLHASREQPVFVLRQLVALPGSQRDAESPP